MKIELLNNIYEVIKDDNNVVNKEELNEYVTDYYNNYDYIVGDYAYNKLRLKGFNKKNNPRINSINDYEKLDEYLREYCAYNCKYFILEKLEKSKK